MIQLVAALALMSASATQVDDPTADDPIIQAGAVLDRMHQAASDADGPVYFDQFTPTARFIGTDAAERWSLAQFRAYAEPYFSKGRGWTYRPFDRDLTLAPGDCRCIIWFDELLRNDAYGVTRGSGVLRRTEGGWKIEQYVLSFTVPNDKARDVVDVIAEDAAD